ncbi:hypothetical protein CERZMDRAFT_52809, partial [Cercospora zeae-maydis SCOH1-5]
LLDHGADINASTKVHKPALRRAAKGADEDLVRSSLDRGAEINTRSGEPSATALQAAFVQGKKKIVRILLDSGASVDVDGEAYGTALQIASSTGHKITVQRLLEHGAIVKAWNKESSELKRALSAAVPSGYRNIVVLLLDRGANIDSCDSYMGNALYHACLSGQSEIVAF